MRPSLVLDVGHLYVLTTHLFFYQFHDFQYLCFVLAARGEGSIITQRKAVFIITEVVDLSYEGLTYQKASVKAVKTKRQ